MLEKRDVVFEPGEESVVIQCPCGEEVVLKLNDIQTCPGCQATYQTDPELIVHVLRDGKYQGSW